MQLRVWIYEYMNIWIYETSLVRRSRTSDGSWHRCFHEVRVLTVFEGEVYWRELGFQLDNHIINNITITTAIARKLRLTLVIEEHFEFTIRAAHTVKISACAHCIVRLPLDFRHTTAIQPPYNRHSEQVPVHKYRYIYQFCYISAKSGIKPSN